MDIERKGTAVEEYAVILTKLLNKIQLTFEAETRDVLPFGLAMHAIYVVCQTVGGAARIMLERQGLELPSQEAIEELITELKKNLEEK